MLPTRNTRQNSSSLPTASTRPVGRGLQLARCAPTPVARRRSQGSSCSAVRRRRLECQRQPDIVSQLGRTDRAHGGTAPGGRKGEHGTKEGGRGGGKKTH